MDANEREFSLPQFAPLAAIRDPWPHDLQGDRSGCHVGRK
jgi:hypothetical protein